MSCSTNLTKTIIAMATKKQTQSINSSGSFVNWLMSNNSTLPEVGKGATVNGWSDRYAYQVVYVSKDQSECVIQRCDSIRIDKNGMSESQEYDYSQLTQDVKTLVWRKKKGGCWCIKSKEVRFSPKFQQECGNEFPVYALTDEQKEAVYGDSHFPANVVDGITKEYTNYTKINITFGVMREYRDFSF